MKNHLLFHCVFSADLTAEELTRTLYPNLVASPGPELQGMDQDSLVRVMHGKGQVTGISPSRDGSGQAQLLRLSLRLKILMGCFISTTCCLIL